MWVVLFLITGANCFVIPSLEDSDNSCTHPDCVEFATQLSNSLNRSVNPCENFFEYACGGWNQRHPAKAMEQSGIIYQQMKEINERIQVLLQTDPVEGEEAFNKARSSFKTCMEYDHSTFLQAFYDMTQTLGGWPMVEGAAWSYQHYYPSLSEVFPVLAKLRLIKPNGALFTVGTTPNLEDVNSPKLVLTPPTLNSLPLPRLTTQQDKAIMMSQLMQTAKVFNPLLDDQQLIKDISDMFHLNDILYSFFYNSNAPKENNPRNAKEDYTIEELEAVTKVEWEEFFTELLEGITEVELDAKIAVPGNTLYYLYQLIRQITEPYFNPRAVINYEMLGLLNQLAQIGNFLKNGQGSITLNSMFSPSKNVETLINLTRAAATDKGSICTELLSQSYGYAIAWKYVLEYDELEKQRQVAKEITENIFEVFGERLEKINWMDESTKNAAELKAKNMKGYYVYPDWNEHLDEVNDFYGDMMNMDNFIKDFINIQKFVIKVDLKEYAQVSKYQKWVMAPLVTNAYYYRLDNAMRILDGMMQKPIFNPNRMRSMNYGSLGSFIGHEITHGFDQNGVLFDLNGKINPWMSESSKKHFDEGAQCFKNQYSQYVLTGEELPGSSEYHVNGEVTADENIADNGGLQQAYFAYLKILEKVGPEVVPDSLKDVSPEQLFFLSFAHTWCTNYGANPQWSATFDQDTHCVNKFRVIGTLSNFDEFHKTFGCHSGDKMVNKDQCKIW